jgi:hypothetical protein
LQSDGFYTAEFQASGKCHVQINKDPDNAGETVFEAAVDGQPYTTLEPTYHSSGILAEIDLPAGFNVRIKSSTPVTYAAVI